jgi:hypothetical protein
MCVSSGLLFSDVGVRTVGFGLVGSSPEGYERGSVRRILDERDDVDEAIDGAMSLIPVDVDAIDSRERIDEFDEVYDEAIELRPG